MPKIIKDKELLQIVTKSITDQYCIDDCEQYEEFLADLAGVVTKHFGGYPVSSSYRDDDIGYVVTIAVNDSVPEDGGIYAAFDPDVKWQDGKEV